MVQRRFRHILAGALAALTVTAALSVGPVAAQRGGAPPGGTPPQVTCGDGSRSGPGGSMSLMVIGLTADQRLICLPESNPARATDIGRVSGLAGDSSLVGIDFRPSNTTLYGVGNAGGVYTINPGNAQAMKVAQLSVGLNGTSFGVDVNPAADALRAISDTGQNLRFSFAAGTTTMDGTLTYPPSTAAASGVTGAAYTNNDADANTGTTLYDLDSVMDQVAIQSPANSGQLVATGKLGVDTNPQVGFDINSTIRNGTTVDVRALASLTAGGQSRLYRVNLFTGKAELVGTFSPQNQVIGIAIPLNQS
jgi:hypothetical protein